MSAVVLLVAALQSEFGSIDRTLVISLNDNMTCVNFPVVNDKTALRPVVTLNFTIELVDTSDPNVVIDPTADKALVLIIDDEGENKIFSTCRTLQSYISQYITRTSRVVLYNVSCFR